MTLVLSFHKACSKHHLFSSISSIGLRSSHREAMQPLIQSRVSHRLSACLRRPPGALRTPLLRPRHSASAPHHGLRKVPRRLSSAPYIGVGSSCVGLPAPDVPPPQPTTPWAPPAAAFGESRADLWTSRVASRLRLGLGSMSAPRSLCSRLRFGLGEAPNPTSSVGLGHSPRPRPFHSASAFRIGFGLPLTTSHSREGKSSMEATAKLSSPRLFLLPNLTTFSLSHLFSSLSFFP